MSVTVENSIVIASSPARVWRALTAPEQIARWQNGVRVETNWTPGAPITFSGEFAGKRYRDKGVVLAVEPERLLSYRHWSRWSRLPDAPENYSTVSMHLAPEGTGTRLTVFHADFVQDEAARHAAFHWKATLPVIKQTVESGA